MKTEIVDVVKFNKTETKRGQEVVKEVEQAVATIATSETRLAKEWVRLGTLLAEMEDKQYWRLLEFPTFTSYVDSVGEKVSKARTQLFGYMKVIRQLGPYLSNDEMQAAGRSKLMELSRAVKLTGLPPTAEVVQQATDSNISLAAFKENVIEYYNLKNTQKETTSYYDFGVSFLTAEEKKEVEFAKEIAIELIGFPYGTPEQEVQKQVFLSWIREFTSTNVQEYNELMGIKAAQGDLCATNAGSS